jgi:oxygen-independent coproporphyrinogen-3 oxidase
VDALQHLGVRLSEKTVSRWMERGFLKRQGPHLVLEGDGWLFMDSVVADLYSNLE